MKKSLSILSVMILLSILIYSAALGEVYGDWEYSSSDSKTCTIKKYNGSEAEVTVPSVLNGYEVTSIGSRAFYNCSSLVSIEIPDSVKSVGASTFEGCSNLESVKMPKDETFLRSSLFKNCSSLKSVELPDGITQVGDSVFSGCPVHKRFCSIASETTYALSKTDYSFVDKAYEKLYLRYEYDEDKKEILGFKVSFAEEDISEVKIPDGITSIGSYAFDNCKNVSSIDLPNSITVVGEGAFTGCNCKRYCDIGSNTAYALSEVGYSFTDKEFDKLSLKYEYDKDKEEFYGLKVVDADEDIREAKIPDSVTSIGNSAFYNCSSLQSVEIPEGIKDIGDFAFYGCSALISLNVPKQVASIGVQAFWNCSSLTSIKIPEGVACIESSTFYNCSSLMNVEIPNSVTEIKSGAFEGCISLKNLRIPESVTSIDHMAFENCINLTRLNIPKSVVSIGNYVFSGCSSLTSIEIPEGVTTIGKDAFYNCSSLTSVSISEGITSIGKNAFYNCSSLINVEIPESVTSIGSHAFYNCSTLSVIEIPESVTSLEDYTFANCCNLIEADLPDGITNVEKGVFLGCNARRYCSIGSETAYALSKARYSFRVKENEKLSLRYEFEHDEMTGLKVISADEDIIEAKIPERVTSIGESAFSDCGSLTSIEIPNSVTNIESFAFEGCSSLTSIEIPESVTSFGEYIFNNCSSLTNVEIPKSVTGIENFTFWNCSSLASIEIPGNVTGIGFSAFRDCTSLTSVEIPENVTSIGGYAFYNCSNLSSVEIPEGVTRIGTHAFNNCGLQTIIIPEGVCSIGDAALQCMSLKKMFLPKSVREIDGSPILKSTTVYCYEYSYAESWARDNGYTVVLIDEKPFSEIGSIDVKNKIYVANGVNTRVKADIFPLLPEITVEWTSSDPEIFTVKDGVITGRKNGTATLTITAGDLSATSEVTVVTAAEGFTLEDMYVPAKGTAEAVVTGIVPADATLDIEWSTEDSVIASVTKEGLVTGKVLGDTTLTAVDSISGLERTASVHIIGPIDRVEFEQESAEMIPLERWHLTVTGYSGDYSFQNQPMTYTSDNESIAVVDEKGFVQAKSVGEATITAQTASGAKASCRIIVHEPAIMLIPASATEIAAGAFEGTGAELYVIPETTKIIGARAFADMEKARVIVLPEGIEADPTAFDGTDATFIRPDGTAVQ